MKNNKGHVAFIVLVSGTLIFVLLMASVSYISSMSIRGQKILDSRQLDELSQGGILYGVNLLKKEIDYVKATSDLQNIETPKKSDYNSDGTKHTYEINSKTGTSTIETEIALYNEAVDNDPFSPGVHPVIGASEQEFESYQLKKVEEDITNDVMDSDATHERILHINNATDVCIEITWDNPNPDTIIRLEVDKVKPKGNIPAGEEDDPNHYEEVDSNSWVIVPIENPRQLSPGKSPDPDNTQTPGLIGYIDSTQWDLDSGNPLYYNIDYSSDDPYPPSCAGSNQALIPKELFYTYQDNVGSSIEQLVNGYGPYKITISNEGGTHPSNLQLKILYNRLSYRTFKITANVYHNGLVKDNTSAIVRAYYDEEEYKTTPRFKFIRWMEGDE